jgi:hypothetical protein
MTLSERLNDAPTREAVIDDCVNLVESEVDNKKGLGGMVIKTGYKTVKGIKPGFIKKVVSDLLGPWSVALEPHWQSAQQSGKVGSYFASHTSEVAEALLGVTDEKSKSAKSSTVRGLYDKLRPTAKKHVEEAVPGLGSILERRLG